MEARVLSISYHVPEVIISTNDYKSFRKHLSEGFFVSNRKDGYCILKKNSEVLVKVQYEGTQSTSTVNLKKEISAYYGIGKTRQLITRFKEDLEKGKVRLEDSEGYFSIIEQ